MEANIQDGVDELADFVKLCVLRIVSIITNKIPIEFSSFLLLPKTFHFSNHSNPFFIDSIQ